MKFFQPALAIAALIAAGICTAGKLEVTVLDKEGKPVPDAVVVLVTADPRSPSPGLPAELVITQQNMRFLPAVSVVPVGAKARFINNDAWEHHVRASPAGAAQFAAAGGTGFELRLDGKAEGKPAKSADAVFDKAGAVLLGCHLHNSMRGHVYVSESPWAALTGGNGTAMLDGVPDGPATVKVWHADQLIDVLPQQLSLGAAPATATFQLNVVPRRRRI